MQTLITCGTPWCEIQPLQALLESAGMGAPRPAASGAVTAINQWHDRFFQSQHSLNAPLRPGKPWELAAGEIFLANWDQPVWGWADSRNTWMLEFWRDFDPSTRFILLYTPAYDALCRAIADAESEEFDREALVAAWCASQTEALRFYHRNRDRSVLLHAHSVRTAAADTVQAINQAFGTTLRAPYRAALGGGLPKTQPESAKATDPLLHLVVQSLLLSHPEVRALEDELLVTLPNQGQDQSHNHSAAPVNVSAAAATLRAVLTAQSHHRKELERAQLHATQSAQAAADAQAQLSALQAENAQRAQGQQQELTQENELLLLQLHQVQEELEHYFLQHQQAVQEKQVVEATLAKMLARYPEHTEWDRIEFLSTTVPLRCQIHGLKAGARQAAMFDLSVDVINKTPVLVLAPPSDSAQQPPLHLNPSAPRNSKAAALLRSLSPGDIQLLRAACAAMSEALPADLSGRETWVKVIATLREQLAQLPPAWRFDTVQLKRQQVNPDYEHLWFELGNVSFAGRHWPTFEFRLSAANVKKGQFSYLPKLEFPKVAQGLPQFENWYEESEDERGPKFELRFDIKNKAMDMGLWNALSPTDQAQALSMCEQLPSVLNRLQGLGQLQTQKPHTQPQISRPWADWQQLVAGLQSTMDLCLGSALSGQVAPQSS